MPASSGHLESLLRHIPVGTLDFSGADRKALFLELLVVDGILKSFHKTDELPYPVNRA